MENKGKICSVEDCNKPADTKGLCQMHYTRDYRYGRLERIKIKQNPICIIEDCNRKPVAKNLCRKHYYYLWTYGDIDVKKTYKMRLIEKKYNTTVKELCYKLHHMDNLPLYKIAENFNLSYDTVCDWFKQFKIEVKNYGNFEIGQPPWIKGKKGFIPWNKGLTKETDERIKKYAEEHKGYKHTDENLKKMSDFLKKRWKNPEDAEKMIMGLQIRPNKAELFLDSILQKYFPDQWRYVGDGQTIINGLCPDFINCNGEKKIIELFGERWHKGKNIGYHQTEKGRKEVFGELGFSMLIIWGRELRDETFLVQKIKEWSNE